MEKKNIQKIEIVTPENTVLTFDGGSNPIEGKTVAVYGESVCTGYPKATTVQDRDLYSFVNRAVLELGGKVINKGVNNGAIRSSKANGGAFPDSNMENYNLSFTRLAASTNYQNALLDIADEVDLFFFFYTGINDYAADPSDFADVSGLNMNTRDTRTYLGAYNFVIHKLLQKKPDARIALTTCYSQDIPVFSPYTGVMKNAIEIIEAIGRYWGIPVFSWYRQTGLVHKPDFENFTTKMSPTDKLHPVQGVIFDALLKNLTVNFLRTLII
jgi:hypothetical protein